MRTDILSVSWITSCHDRSKVRLPGTSRAQAPSAALEMAARAAPLVGVTRVADLTRLDTIGIPTFQAIWRLADARARDHGRAVARAEDRLAPPVVPRVHERPCQREHAGGSYAARAV